MAETPEDQRPALVERIAQAILPPMGDNGREWHPDEKAAYDAERRSFTHAREAAELVHRRRSAEAVLSLLESGRAGVWLVPAAGVLDTVGVIIRQLRDAKAALSEARAEVERLRGQRDAAREDARRACAETERLRVDMEKFSDRTDDALDWLMEWALAQEMAASQHYWHICDGKAASCGCPYEGETDRNR